MYEGRAKTSLHLQQGNADTADAQIRSVSTSDNGGREPARAGACKSVMAEGLSSCNPEQTSSGSASPKVNNA